MDFFASFADLTENFTRAVDPAASNLISVVSHTASLGITTQAILEMAHQDRKKDADPELKAVKPVAKMMLAGML
ncbi:MAG: hypothetical protein OXT65_09615 [Alphaproteobacteria bacterium]|nr:hypothetical protein [Alphaproteobacteria bacterium]